MADLAAQRANRNNKHETLFCEARSCRRRIAWWTQGLALKQLVDAEGALGHDDGTYFSRGWAWQGKRAPIRWRETAEGFVADLECFSCGWRRTRNASDLPFLRYMVAT